MSHSEEADNVVPRRVSGVLLHIVDTHVDQVKDIVMKLEMELDSVELELDKGGPTLKKQMLDDRRFPKMHLNLQRLLQLISVSAWRRRCAFLRSSSLDRRSSRKKNTKRLC